MTTYGWMWMRRTGLVVMVVTSWVMLAADEWDWRIWLLIPLLGSGALAAIADMEVYREHD